MKKENELLPYRGDERGAKRETTYYPTRRWGAVVEAKKGKQTTILPVQGKEVKGGV